MHIFKPQNGSPGESDVRNFRETRDQPFNRQRSHDSSGSEGRGNRHQEYDSRIFRRHSGNKRVEFEDEVMAQQKFPHNREAVHPYKRPQRRNNDRDTEDDLPFKGFNQNFESFGGNRNDRRNQGRFGNREQRDRRDNYRDIRLQYQNDHDDRDFDHRDRRDNYRDNRDYRSKQRNEHDDRGDRRDRQENYRDARQNQRGNYNDRFDRQNSWGNRRDGGQQNRNEQERIVRSNSFGGGDRLAHNNSKQGDDRLTRSKSFRGNEARNDERNDENRAPPYDERRNQENEHFVSCFT